MKSTDPARMSREDILAELGELLTAGFQRHISSSMRYSAGSEDSRFQLDGQAADEAQCASTREEDA